MSARCDPQMHTAPSLRATRLRVLVFAVSWALSWPHVGESADATSPQDEEAGLEEIVVTSTRSPTLIRDAPMRVEAVPAEEIEENLTIQPGNVSTLLKELPGVRVQASVPGLGGAAMQLRGMPGRHTLVLADGLPLLGAEPDAFGLLQTPPLDLSRAEVIKGAVSALYGGSALGGVLNLISRTPDAEPGMLANVNSRGGRDAAGFFTAKGARGWSGTFTMGAHDQSREDVNGDGWADLVAYRRYTLRPRLWRDDGAGHSLFLTAGLTNEEREGGTMPGRVLPDGSAFPEALHTRRIDAGAVSHWAFDNQEAVNARLSLTSTHLDRTFGAQRVASAQTTAFGEIAWNGETRRHRWVLGGAFVHDQLAVAAVPGVTYTYNVPAVFAQDEYAPSPWLILAGSARVDAHNELGTFMSPRLSALFREPNSAWSLRASVGMGFAAPTPFVDEIEATGFGALLPLRALHAERATTTSLDLKWARSGWDVNASVFTSEIRDALEVLPQPGNNLELVNAPGPRRAPGAELLIGYVMGPLHVIAGWSTLDATEVDASGVRHDAPLVPRHTATLDGIIESNRRGRIGLELDYTGLQALADNPYRTESRSYCQLNALAELRFGKFAVFMNALNVTDVRQTYFDPLIRPKPGPGGDPITAAWAPLDGRTFNLGIRAEL